MQLCLLSLAMQSIWYVCMLVHDTEKSKTFQIKIKTENCIIRAYIQEFENKEIYGRFLKLIIPNENSNDKENDQINGHRIKQWQ